MPELATKADLLAMKQELLIDIRSSFAELRNDIHCTMGELRHSIAQLHNSLEIFELRLTIRLGVMILLAMWAAVIIMKCM